ncbi:class I SAM-dependent methyltransferase [Azospirillum soli]|uniref:class I SAM-dependent methyltransferase n=1 Tax=Azospirillum soli TaxID=1304799 RepID=UPI001AE11E94|nr:class I SAM-dependent methyltransferase [Azospirillum soli]MBP2312736.1 SAM-dependent methyltransferase [Azospirillum soli]
MQATARRTYDWTATWRLRLGSYLSAVPRAGLFLSQLPLGRFDTVLEIACGSARDSLYLREIGKTVVATDSNAHVIQQLDDQFEDLPNIDFRVENAAALTFRDRQFDVSFHNGFFVLFDDNAFIKELLREQARVTRSHLFFIVHNGHNETLKRKFKEKSREDTIYDLRFFRRQDIETIVRESGIPYRHMRIYNFGSPADRFLGERIKGIPNPLRGIAAHNVKALYALTPLTAAERLVCHIEL